MRILLTLLSLLSFLSSFAQWVVIDTVQSEYFQIYFYDINIGYISSYDFYKKTTDGGLTWNTTTDMGGNNRYDFYFLNQDTGFSRLGVTHDGGQNWISLH